MPSVVRAAVAFLHGRHFPPVQGREAGIASGGIEEQAEIVVQCGLILPDERQIIAARRQYLLAQMALAE